MIWHSERRTHVAVTHISSMTMNTEKKLAEKPFISCFA